MGYGYALASGEMVLPKSKFNDGRQFQYKYVLLHGNSRKRAETWEYLYYNSYPNDRIQNRHLGVPVKMLNVKGTYVFVCMLFIDLSINTVNSQPTQA